MWVEIHTDDIQSQTGECFRLEVSSKCGRFPNFCVDPRLTGVGGAGTPMFQFPRLAYLGLSFPDLRERFEETMRELPQDHTHNL